MSKKRFADLHCENILREAGARQVKVEAIGELRKSIENIALEISKRAVDIAYENSRWKVNREDILRGVEELLGRKRTIIVSNKALER
jgi:histone H3/H4